MFNRLTSLERKVRLNKRGIQGPCEDCALVKKYKGPVFVRHEGKTRPKVMLISESPAVSKSFGYDTSNPEVWLRKVLKDISDPRWKRRKPEDLTTLGPFLAALTANRMVSDSEDLATVNSIYWTHAMKCFAQQKGESIERAKKRLGRGFKGACKCCAKYLSEEVEIVGPELIVMMGNKAFDALVGYREDLVGKPLWFPELLFMYHPNSRNIELRRRGSTLVKKELAKYL